MNKKSSLAFCAMTMIGALAVPLTWAQSIATHDNVETDAQLVSNVATGTAPLTVASTTMVTNLNTEYLGGHNELYFAPFSYLTPLWVAIDNHNPDPPCFDNTHRFVDCNNGTVTDTVTGVTWLKKTNCFPTPQDYTTANATAAALFDRSIHDPGDDCDLSDGSRVGDWRLATKEEWLTILKPTCSVPKILGNGEPVSDCHVVTPWATGPAGEYWASTSDATNVGLAWAADLDSGTVGYIPKSIDAGLVWPVRDCR